VVAALVEVLTEVEGIGPKTAQSVRWAVEEKTVTYSTLSERRLAPPFPFALP